MNTPSPVLLDCTLRDGGYHNAWDFSDELINDYLQAMATLAADYVELGFRSLKRIGFMGACAYTSDGFVRRLKVPPGIQLGVMVNASEVIQHPRGMNWALDLLFTPAAESPVRLVRLACHIHEIEAGFQACDWLKDKGYVVGLNLMQIADRTVSEIQDVGSLAARHPIDVLYFADSMGSMNPGTTGEIVKALRQGWAGALGIHAHDNMGQGLANSLRALADGVTWVDGTVTGMGRGAGNVKTEYLVVELADRRSASPNLTPLLSIIDRHFQPMQAKCGWGTNTYYYLAGKHGIHPTYIQEMLTDQRYGHEDIMAVIEYLRKVGGKKFNEHTLEAGRIFFSGEPGGSWRPADVIAGREVLVIGSGQSATRHRAALEDYIQRMRPFVIVLNARTPVRDDLIDMRAASHPVRLLADSAKHLALAQPLVTPVSMLPKSLAASLDGKKLLDFGMSVEAGCYRFGENFCILPTNLVIAYALAIAASGRASRVLLAGFDGYAADDPRNAEVESLMAMYQQAAGVPPLLGITPSRYKFPITSVYAMI